eukprot:6003270-Prymnesium_polylepis.1
MGWEGHWEGHWQGRREACVEEDEADEARVGEGEACLNGARGDEVGGEVDHPDDKRREERRDERAELRGHIRRVAILRSCVAILGRWPC